ncbi:putative short tail fiber protein [Alteromonas phage vB_AmeP_R8W]|uniref:Putative short tail fiber protein n=1 Tax=Alteromonas phage vB_AmeP_R8W TaxID=2774152 RepID=A0A8E4RFY9_9CAUD|nr:putative short tail fiber protein [Alteromonas phage vB_AmeP_R8W]
MNLQLLEKWDLLTVKERRDKLTQFEEVCKSVESEAGVTIEPKIYSADGVYAREIFIPKGTALVGEIHLKAQINVVSKGKIRVATEEGVREIEAPCTFVSPAGTKRAGYVLEDTVWTTFLPTDKVSDEEVYSEFIAPDYETLDKQLEHKECHSLQQQ